MYTRQRLYTKTVDASEHQTNITNAAMWYIQSDTTTVDRLAKTFQVTGNTINTWLCEAVAKSYIPSLTMCKQLITKHILEYETKHNLKNSSLRQMYKSALEARNINISVGA